MVEREDATLEMTFSFYCRMLSAWLASVCVHSCGERNPSKSLKLNERSHSSRVPGHARVHECGYVVGGGGALVVKCVYVGLFLVLFTVRKSLARGPLLCSSLSMKNRNRKKFQRPFQKRKLKR